MKLFLSLTFFIAFSSSTFSTQALNFAVYQREVNGITFRVDPRVELYNIIAMQAGHNGMTLSNIPYKKECLDYFAAPNNQGAPRVLAEAWQKGWPLDQQLFFVLSLDENLNLKKGTLPHYDNKINLVALAKAFKDFARQYGYEAFFNERQKGFYEQVLQYAVYNFKDFEGISHMERYYGTRHKNYFLILNLIGAYGNFGRSFNTKKGTDLYAVLETQSHAHDIPLYAPTISTAELLLHEFSHGFVNPSLEPLLSSLAPHDTLYKPIAGAMQQQGYTDWSAAVIEHVVRAAVTRVAGSLYGNEFADHYFYKMLMAREFIYAGAILDRLRRYEENRTDFKQLATFMPELVRVFGSVSEAYIQEQQQQVSTIKQPDISQIPKPHAYARDSSTYFIVGTHEADKQSEAQVHDFVARYRGMMSEEIQIITDEEALARDLSGHDLVLFGTPNGNSFLRQHLHRLPVIITDSYLITNKLIEGTNLQLVTSWVNPYDKASTMTMYTAQQVSDINNFNYSPVRDNYHYWVAQNLITLDKGDYEPYFNTWMPKLN